MRDRGVRACGRPARRRSGGSSPRGRARWSHSVGRGAGGGLALADLVAVDEQHVGAAAGQLAGNGQPGEAGAADEHVVRAVDRRALVAALGLPARHGRERSGRRPFAATRLPTRSAINLRRVHGRRIDRCLPSEGTPVEGSNGLLLEIDGQVVPNYAATMVSFDEGDVVTGKVVRIDKDEVLVDIGYKSRRGHPLQRALDPQVGRPSEEVELGEEVDALVLTKEDQEGRLILSKKRARFEKAWRRIEAAAESGEPVEGTVIEVVKGGLILDLGVRGFLPASLVDIRRVHNLDEFMGQSSSAR